MNAPRTAVTRRVVHQQSLKPVQSIRKARSGRLAFLEFIPQCANAASIVIGEQTEKPVSRSCLSFRFIEIRGRVECKRVAGIDLDYIVNQKHLYHPADVRTRRRILGQRHSHRSKMPRMLCGIFESRPVYQ